MFPRIYKRSVFGRTHIVTLSSQLQQHHLVLAAKRFLQPKIIFPVGIWLMYIY